LLYSKGKKGIDRKKKRGRWGKYSITHESKIENFTGRFHWNGRRQEGVLGGGKRGSS